MKYLAIVVLLLCGCHNSHKVKSSPPPANKFSSKSIRESLVGTWCAKKGKDEFVYQFLNDSKYSLKWGRLGFTKSYYWEAGNWEIYDDQCLGIAPMDRKNLVSKSDREFLRTILKYKEEMDEGAWKPAGQKINFPDKYTLKLTSLVQPETTTYHRVP